MYTGNWIWGQQTSFQIQWYLKSCSYYVQQNFIHHVSTILYLVQFPKSKKSFSKIKFVKPLTVKICLKLRVMFEIHNFVVILWPFPSKLVGFHAKLFRIEICATMKFPPKKVWMTFFFHFKCNKIAQSEKIYSLFQTWNLARKIFLFHSKLWIEL